MALDESTINEIEVLLKNKWTYGYLIEAANKCKFDFKRSVEFDEYIKRRCAEEIKKEMLERVKDSFKFTEQMYKEDGESRFAQYESSKFKLQVIEGIINS